MEKKFRVGDRVKIVDSIPENVTVASSAKMWLGKTMTIAHINTSLKGVPLYLMREDFGTHFWTSKSIASLAEPKRKFVVSYEDGLVRVEEVVNGKVIRSVEGVPEDGTVHNPEEALISGVKVFFEERNTPYNTKIVCVRAASSCFTKGKVYEVTDGVLVDDNGDMYEDIKGFADIEDALESKFIKIVESEPIQRLTCVNREDEEEECTCKCHEECSEDCPCECHEEHADGCDCKDCNEDDQADNVVSE